MRTTNIYVRRGGDADFVGFLCGKKCKAKKQAKVDEANKAMAATVLDIFTKKQQEIADTKLAQERSVQEQLVTTQVANTAQSPNVMIYVVGGIIGIGLIIGTIVILKKKKTDSANIQEL